MENESSSEFESITQPLALANSDTVAIARLVLFSTQQVEHRTIS